MANDQGPSSENQSPGIDPEWLKQRLEQHIEHMEAKGETNVLANLDEQDQAHLNKVLVEAGVLVVPGSHPWQESLQLVSPWILMALGTIGYFVYQGDWIPGLVFGGFLLLPVLFRFCFSHSIALDGLAIVLSLVVAGGGAILSVMGIYGNLIDKPDPSRLDWFLGAGAAVFLVSCLLSIRIYPRFNP